MNTKKLGSTLLKMYDSEEFKYYDDERCDSENKRDLKRRIVRMARVYISRLPKGTKVVDNTWSIAMYVAHIYNDDFAVSPSRWIQMSNKRLKKPFKNIREFNKLFYKFLKDIDYKCFIDSI